MRHCERIRTTTEIFSGALGIEILRGLGDRDFVVLGIESFGEFEDRAFVDLSMEMLGGFGDRDFEGIWG